jgi:hypothetical protein
MRMFRGWFQSSKWLPCLGRILLKSTVLLCVFCGKNDSMQNIFINKCFLFTVGSVCHVKRFTTAPLKNHLSGKSFAVEEETEMWVRKWLRQQPKDFCAAGFDALVKQWDKCINVGGGYVEKLMFFLGSNITCFTLRFISICDLFTDCPSYNDVSEHDAVSLDLRGTN